MVPYRIMYDLSKQPPGWLEGLLRRHDPLLHLRFHRFRKVWCVTRTKRKPGRVDEDLVLECRPEWGLTEHIYHVIRRMDTYAWKDGMSLAESLRIREEAKERRRDMAMDRKMSDIAMSCGREWAKASLGRISVKVPSMPGRVG